MLLPSLPALIATRTGLILALCFYLLEFSIFSIHPLDLIIPSSALSLTSHLLTDIFFLTRFSRSQSNDVSVVFLAV